MLRSSRNMTNIIHHDLSCTDRDQKLTHRLCISQGEGDAGFVKNNKLYSFSTIVLTSWDYHLTDWEAARNLRISIRTQLKEMLNDAIDFDNRPSEYAELLVALPKVGTLDICLLNFYSIITMMSENCNANHGQSQLCDKNRV